MKSQALKSKLEIQDAHFPGKQHSGKNKNLYHPS